MTTEVLCRTLEGLEMTAEVDRSSDPGRPIIRLECGCNEFWLEADEGRAVLEYLQRTLPLLKSAEI